MTGIGDPPPDGTPSSRPPDETRLPEEPGWPQQDLATEPAWDVKVSGNRRRPTTAEQAVPWLIGLVLALAGMLIVLLALVFSSNDGLLPAYGSPSPEPTSALTPTPRPTPTPEPSTEATPSLEASATPEPVPTSAYPPLEIVFMQRTSVSGPIHLFTHDFATQEAPVPQARDDRGVDTYSWSPDGVQGIALVDGNPLVLLPGNSARDLGDGFDGIAFAPDSVTAYAVRATLAGANDRIELLQVDTPSGAVQTVTAWAHPHPIIYQESPAEEAQFLDDGGFNRVYYLDDGRVAVSILGAPAIYWYKPATAETGTLDRQPVLWSPNVQLRVELAESGGNTTLTVRGLANENRGAIGVQGYVSHLRWSSQSNEVVFTLTTSLAGGAIAQDLYLWDISGTSLVRLTQDQRTMGAEFRGVRDRWKP